MRKNNLFFILTIMIGLTGCTNTEKTEDKNDDFNYNVEQFADIRIVRYKVPGFEELSLKQKELIYYLNQAALCGRDIIFDQNYKHNLLIRRTLEEIVKNYEGDRTTEEFKQFMIYVKRVWFANGIHHHYSTDKFEPGFTKEYLKTLINNSNKGEFASSFNSIEELTNTIIPLIFDKDVAPKRVCQDSKMDIVKNSANNFYENITQEEVEQYYAAIMDTEDKTPISYGLNSKIEKTADGVTEKTYKKGGMYSEAIVEIIKWLNKAATVAENEIQKNVILKLIEYYETGDLELFDDYSILWVNDLDSRIDFINGFIEVYGDPLGMKASWEAMVNFKNIEATKRAELLSANAQWFEDHSPIEDRFKKEEVKGVSAKVITAAIIGGDCYPSTPIGINLPNADWIRKEHGSKSVTIQNITDAYHMASLDDGLLEEFAASEEEIKLAKKYGNLAGNLHTDLHECLGHGSGQILPDVPLDALKNYASPLEEARADLFALYYLLDEKLVEIGIMPSLDAGKAVYNSYIRNGLMMQLTRIKPGKNIEQAHMRCRQLISKWCYEKGKDEGIISKIEKDNKTYIEIKDYAKLRDLFGKLLREIQYIKSTGDYEKGKELVEKYGVKVDSDLHAEVLKRYKKLGLAPYGGFINPVYTPIYDGGDIVDVTIEYPNDYVDQMLYYSDKYSFLPDYN